MEMICVNIMRQFSFQRQKQKHIPSINVWSSYLARIYNGMEHMKFKLIEIKNLIGLSTKRVENVKDKDHFCFLEKLERSINLV
jgi:hypothetical protein